MTKVLLYCVFHFNVDWFRVFIYYIRSLFSDEKCFVESDMSYSGEDGGDGAWWVTKYVLPSVIGLGCLIGNKSGEMERREGNEMEGR